MREIKFRGKRIDNGEWVYGAFIPMHHNDERNHIHAFIIPEGSDLSHGVILDSIMVAVKPETIGQYTGLADKNGVGIYEGDTVIAYRHNEIPFGFDITENHGMLWFGNWHWLEFQNDFRNLEVIGNIHDKEDAL